MREKCPYSELFWSLFSHIRTEYEEMLRISPYSVRMQEYTDQNNSEYGHFLRSVCLFIILKSHMIHMYIYKLIQTEDPEGYNL